MSGKEPPRGPRALRVSASTPSTTQNQNHNYQPQPQPTASGSRQPAALGALPPKGPRSLAGGNRHTPPPPPSKPYINGHNHGHGNAFGGAFGRVPPSGPKADRAPPSGPSALLGSAQRHPNGAPTPAPTRAPISFSLAPPPPKQPPPPPPPGPPPNSERPPSPTSHASPPSQVPHFRSPISIRLPNAQPQEPRLAPPPLPPAPVEPPEPPAPHPPAFEPPPLPPADPRRLSSFPPPPPQYVKPSDSPTLDSPSRSPSPVESCLPENVTATWTNPPGAAQRQQLFSLNVPPMPERSSYTTPADRDFRLLFDEQCDKDRYIEMKSLAQTLRTAGEDERLKERGKGKMPLIYRFAGETVKDEREARPSDPRKAVGFKPPKPRAEFYSLTYERDSNTPGPPPTSTILVYGFPELMRSGDIVRHFRKYGSITSSDRELYREKGNQMGVMVLTYGSHEEARRAVEGEVGKNFATAGIGGGPAVSFANAKSTGMEKDAVKVMFDGEGKLLKLVKSMYEELKRRERLQAQVSEAGGGASGSGGPPGTSVQMAPPAPNGHIPQGPSMQQQYPQGPMARRPFNAPYPNQHPPSQVPPQGPHTLPLKPPSHLAPHIPPRVGASHLSRGSGYPIHNEFGMQGPNPIARRFPPSSVNRARTFNAVRSTVPHNLPLHSHVYGQQTPDTDQSRPVTPMSAVRGRGGARGLAHSHAHTPTYTSTSTPRGSRSPSPATGREKQTVVERDAKHRAVLEALVLNGNDYARIDESQLSSGAAREDDVKDFFKDFPVDKVLHDHTGWYITFKKPDAAGRAARVLAIGTHTLANRSVSVAVYPAPLAADVKALSPASLAKGADARREWKPEELIEEAGKTVMAELRALLQKDVTERIVGAHIRKIVSETRERKGKEEDTSRVQLDNGEIARGSLLDMSDVDRDRRGLKGLTFKKRKQEVAGDIQHIAEPEPALDSVPSAPEEPEVSLSVSKADDAALVTVVLPENNEDQAPVQTPEKEERPRKRQKKAASRIIRDDIESEDDEPGAEAEAKVEATPVQVEDIPPTEVIAISPVQLKRSLSPEPVAEPPPKRTKIEEEPEKILDVAPAIVQVKSKKPSTKKLEKEKKISKKGKKAKAEMAVLEALIIPPPAEIEPPLVTEVRVSPTPAWKSFPSPVPPVSAVSEKALPSPKRYDPLPESILQELIGDDEDLYLSKLSLSLDVENGDLSMLEENAAPAAPSDAPPPFRKHITGSARSEGYYKISHAEKSAYVAQYALRSTAADGSAEKEVVPQQHVVSSRSNRANARRKVQGLEEANQFQLAVALSKGENAAATDVMKFNQLQTRKKHLRFARSPIHDWGLYAMERIGRGEMVIEYVGEVIRAAVADKREKAYERQGIGSSYLFRIDEDLVVDATKKGNLGRLINHSCDPNCTAKIIMIHGEKKIVIYAKQDIELGDEITYDYHFPLEDDKIPCLCGAAKCRGFLN